MATNKIKKLKPRTGYVSLDWECDDFENPGEMIIVASTKVPKKKLKHWPKFTPIKLMIGEENNE